MGNSQSQEESSKGPKDSFNMAVGVKGELIYLFIFIYLFLFGAEH